MRRSRPDSTAKQEAVANLRKMGVTVAMVQGLVPGFPDTVCSWRSVNHLVEFKSLGGRLQDSQVKFAWAWTGCIHIATSSEEAMRLIRECHENLRRRIS